MANTLKPLSSNDITSTRTLLHEVVPITGTIVSGTYGEANTVTEFPAEENIKNFSHGMFQSIYDYPFLSSSANHIFDLSVGYSTSSVWTHDGVSPIPDGNNVQNQKKINIYNQMAQVLMGHDHTGSIKEFQIPGGNVIREAYFINFSRLLVKDEIKKGSLTMSFGLGQTFVGAFDDGNDSRVLNDYGDTTYYTDSPAGDYAILTMSADPPAPEEGGKPAGLVFYQAGIVVLSASMFFPYDSAQVRNPDSTDADNYINISGSAVSGHAKSDDDLSFRELLCSSSITGTTNALRHRIDNIEFQNTTELNSTIHFCRANHNEFNYSSNPTYVSSSKIQVKETNSDSPTSYITTVGLYGSDNVLLAAAKLSEPIKKTNQNEVTIRVRLDY